MLCRFLILLTEADREGRVEAYRSAKMYKRETDPGQCGVRILPLSTVLEASSLV